MILRFNLIIFSLFEYYFRKRSSSLNISYLDSSAAAHDPIEQYDLGVLQVCGFFFYLPLFHLALVSLLLMFLMTRVRFSFFGFLNWKLYTFVKDLYTSVFKTEKQMLFPYFYYTFLFILLSNLVGMLPWSFTITAQLAIACFFSITGFGGLIVLSVEQRGWRFFELFSPAAPKAMLHFLIIIEFISFLIRFVSLAVRLFANMVAGHALLKILLLFFTVISATLGFYSLFGSVVGLLIILVVATLELLIAFLQAYVFVFLLLIYAKEML